MNEETIGYFLSGLRKAIKDMGTTQEDFAEGITTKENLSKILNRRVGTSQEMRKALADKTGKDISEIVLIGKQVEQEQPHIPVTKDIDPLDMLDIVAKAYRQEKDECRYWKSCFDAMVVPVCIVDQDGVVIYQNQADRSLYKADMVGEELCPACRGNEHIPHPCDDCAIEKARTIGEPTEKFITIDETSYRLIASPAITSEGRHIIVMAIPSQELAEVKRERDTLQQQISFLLRTAKTPLVFGDQNQKIAYVSDEFLTLFGVSEKEITTTAEFWAILVEKLKDPTEAVRVCKAARRQIQKGKCEIELFTGEKCTLVASPATNCNGSLIGVLVKVFVN